MSRVICNIVTDMRWVRLFAWIVGIQVFFGWRYSDRTINRLVRIGSKLVRTRVVPVSPGAQVYDPRPQA